MKIDICHIRSIQSRPDGVSNTFRIRWYINASTCSPTHSYKHFPVYAMYLLFKKSHSINTVQIICCIQFNCETWLKAKNSSEVTSTIVEIVYILFLFVLIINRCFPKMIEIDAIIYLNWKMKVIFAIFSASAMWHLNFVWHGTIKISVVAFSLKFLSIYKSTSNGSIELQCAFERFIIEIYSRLIKLLASCCDKIIFIFSFFFFSHFSKK